MKRTSFSLVVVAVTVCVAFLSADVNGNNEPDVKKSSVRDAGWSISDGTLTINGVGQMANYSLDYLPYWLNYAGTLTSIVIENGVTTIGDYAFFNLSQVTRVVIPDTVEYIGESAFQGCTLLAEVKIPDSVQFYGSTIFHGCSSLTEITIPYGWTSVSTGLCHGCSRLTNVSLPSTVKIIEADSFSHCTSMTHLVLPEGVEEIKMGVFNDCRALVHVSLPDTMTSIDHGGFAHCTNLTYLTVPKNMKKIANDAFMDCPNLAVVLYMGTEPLPKYGFYSTVREVCVAPGYNDTSFCGLTITPNTFACKTFRRLFDQCSVPVFYDNDFTQEKRKNATDWESQSNECIRFECDAEKGFVSYAGCDNVCLNNRCVDKKDASIEKKVYVEFEVNEDERVRVNEVNSSEIVEKIGMICKVSTEGFEVGYELDDDGYVLRVVLYLDDEETANIIADRMESKNGEDGGSCSIIICRSKKIHVEGMEDFFSFSPLVHEGLAVIVICIIMTMMVHW